MLTSMYDDPCGPMTSDPVLRNLLLSLDEAQQDGDEERCEEIAAQIQDFHDYRAHCQEKQWEWEREDARFESYWDKYDA